MGLAGCCRNKTVTGGREDGRRRGTGIFVESVSEQFARPLQGGRLVRFERARERARLKLDVFVPVPVRT